MSESEGNEESGSTVRRKCNMTGAEDARRSHEPRNKVTGSWKKQGHRFPPGASREELSLLGPGFQPRKTCVGPLTSRTVR